MGTITISVNDEVEKEFRESVKKKIGQGKGVLGKAVEEAMKKWVHDEEQQKIAAELKKMMDKGMFSLKGWKFNRDELYDRL